MKRVLAGIGLLSIGAAAGIAGEKVYRDYVKTGKLKAKLDELKLEMESKCDCKEKKCKSKKEKAA